MISRCLIRCVSRCALRGLDKRSLFRVHVGDVGLGIGSMRYVGSAVAVPSASGLISFNLADIGEGIAECEILKWYVAPGDRIKQFDKVCEVQSDKATVEITSRYDGVVKELHYVVGAMAKVGKPLISIQMDKGVVVEAKKGSDVQNIKENASQVVVKRALDAVHNENEINVASGKVLTTPSVRKIAKENNIDLLKVHASGPNGRILKEDMLRFISGEVPSIPTPIPAAVPVKVHAVAAPAEKPKAKVSYSFPSLNEDKTIILSGLQRIMVQTMNAANSVPHFGFSEEIIMDEVVKLRTFLKAKAELYHIKLSYMPFIIKATSLALREYPILNAHANADGTEVTLKASHNIGIAMNTPRGLIVPNVKNVQNKSIFEIALELNELQELGKEAKLGREHLTGGTFSLSNIGVIGGTYASPLLVVPEVAIAALGRFQVVPRYNSKMELHPVTTMAISYSGDHRIIDGATIAKFSNVMKNYLETPYNMVGVMH